MVLFLMELNIIRVRILKLQYSALEKFKLCRKRCNIFEIIGLECQIHAEQKFQQIIINYMKKYHHKSIN